MPLNPESTAPSRRDALRMISLGLTSAWVAPEHVRAQGLPPGASWFRDGLVVSSDMEALTFVLRRGGEAQDAVKEWHAHRGEEAVRKLKAAGVNLAIVNFFKGAGFQAEREDIAAAREFTQLAHKQGIRVAGYIGSTMMYETLFLEEPDAHNWRQIDEFGYPMYYPGDQTFRYPACRNNPGYRGFIHKVIRMGVQDIKLDVLHFDQMEWWPEPKSCHCTYCGTQFREFLKRRYQDPHRARLRFGFTDFDGVIPFPFGVHEGPLRMPNVQNPMLQEWTKFRAWSLARDFKEFRDYARQLNPNIVVIGNPGMNLERNVGFIYGVDPQQLFPSVDGVWTEEPNLPEWTRDGRLVSQIRSYKAARTMGRTLFHWDNLNHYALYADTPEVLRLAESLAYNDANLGVIAGGDVSSEPPSPVVKRYVNFFHSNLKYLSHTREIGDVAILRAFASTEFNPGQSNVETVLAEQSLIQSKIPFSIIFDRQLSDLSGFKVLVLADQDALSDAQLKAVRRFVDNGGGLVATGKTSLLTDWRTRRESFGLSDLLGLNLPPSASAPNRPIQRQFGKGRVVYISRIEPAVPAPPPVIDYNFSNKYWKLPKNYDDFIGAVRWAARDEFSATVEAPLWVTAELAEHESLPLRLLHLINFKIDEPVRSIRITVRAPEGRRIRSVRMLDPDRQVQETIPMELHNNQASVTVPELHVYALLLLVFNE